MIAQPHEPSCPCRLPHRPRLVVLTGGPGAGKTAVLEIVRKRFCEHVVVLPEAAGILFGGGFPRREASAARRSAQRAIFHVQRELERLAVEEGHAGVVLCDRGTVDGSAYWPGAPASFFREVSTTHRRELARYAAVIHLRTPGGSGGYGHQNPLRTETAAEARRIDRRILEAWSGHPRAVTIPSARDFMTKAARAIAAIEAVVPACCLRRSLPSGSSSRGRARPPG